MGHNGRKRMLACILQNLTGCSKASQYFWHTAFHILCIGTTKSFPGILNSTLAWALERSLSLYSLIVRGEIKRSDADDGIFIGFFTVKNKMLI